MINSPTISKKPPERIDLDFSRLRAEGIEHIQKLAGEVWTDYNTHDPGITLLELMCYAITDLGYRMNMPMEDILAPPNGDEAALQRQFPSPAQALSCEPVTEKDYRKLFMDIPEVMNAWLTRHEDLRYYLDCKTGRLSRTRNNEQDKEIIINGLYDLHLQLTPDINTSEQKERIFREARQWYEAHRNLCEDLMLVKEIAYRDFCICADIQIEASADTDMVHAQIRYVVQRFLTPPVNRYTLDELLAKGKSPDQIFDGRLPRHGFFDDEELDQSVMPDTARTLRSSDFIGIIMKVPGVVAIPKLHLKWTDDPSEQGALWSIEIQAGLMPRLCPRSPLRFYKDVFRYIDDRVKVNKYLNDLYEKDRKRQENIKNAVSDLPIPSGTWRHLGVFQSIQQDLPAIYGIGEAGLRAGGSEAEMKARQSKARQLQAYLLFFDQILANQAALLDALPALMSASPAGGGENRLRRTWPVGFVEEVRAMQALFKSLTDAAEDIEPQEQAAILKEKLSGFSASKRWRSEVHDQIRRGRFLDHLLARYAERLDDYVLMMHQVFGGHRQAWETIDDKDDFLRNYPFVSRNRARACNVAAREPVEMGSPPVETQVWYDASDAGMPPEKINVAGVVRRVAGLVGIDNFRPRNLAHIHYETYQERDNDNIFELRFRVTDIGGKKILLSGSTKYRTEHEAVNAMRKAVNKAMFPDGYDRRTTTDGRYYFNITDEEGRVVARRIEYFATEELREQAIQYLIDFLTERYSEEGFFVMEHHLLRPLAETDDFLPVCVDEGCHTCEGYDPYSFRVSVILPGYAPRFTNLAFRHYFERILRSELPAHVVAKVCWISKAQMAEFEKRYREWLEYMTGVRRNDRLLKNNRTLNRLVRILQNLHSIHPPGTLHDCEEDKEDRPIVLGRSHLGSQREQDLNPDDGTPVFPPNI